MDWEEHLKHLKEENDNDEFTIVEKPGVRYVNPLNQSPKYIIRICKCSPYKFLNVLYRGRKKLSTLKSPEALTARRRRHWQLLVKKELGKVQRARTATHKELMLQRKRLATLCCKHWRHVAMQVRNYLRL